MTHDIDEAIKMGHRIAILRDGELVQYDTPDNILAAPANEFVADFVGADRGLKRLRVWRLGDLDLDPAPDEAGRLRPPRRTRACATRSRSCSWRAGSGSSCRRGRAGPRARVALDSITRLIGPDQKAAAR